MAVHRVASIIKLVVQLIIDSHTDQCPQVSMEEYSSAKVCQICDLIEHHD
jgi:hypothetical protein